VCAIIKRIPAFIKIIAAVITPFALTIAAFYYYGVQISNEESIYPNISVAGIDVSGLTRDEAIKALGLPVYEERSAKAEISISFPDDSRTVITGNDVILQHNAYELVSLAYTIGRERGILMGAVSYLQRQKADVIYFDIEFTLDESILRSIVTIVTDEYNKRLDASTPQIYDDYIIFTKGAGHVNADLLELIDLAYIGIFESFEEGKPVEIIYTLPETKQFVDDILLLRDQIYIQMLSSEYDIIAGSATESAVGVHFDMIEAATLLVETETGKTAKFDLIYTHPEYSQEYLESILFRDILGRRRTYVGGSANRVSNIELASNYIDGTVLLPGEEFSYNEVVGPRTADRGFKLAPVIINREYATDLGGGICQVSSTLYAAIKPSELLVTERTPHGLPVAYLPGGWDATVAYGLIDFRFVNNTTYPIRIEMKLEERNLTAMVFGTIVEDFPIESGWYYEESWYLDEN